MERGIKELSLGHLSPESHLPRASKSYQSRKRGFRKYRRLYRLINCVKERAWQKNWPRGASRNDVSK